MDSQLDKNLGLIKNPTGSGPDSLRNGVEGIKNIKLIQLLKKEVSGLKLKGTISAGYEYGVLPYVSGDKYPVGGFRSEGRLSFLLASIPLEFTYRYTTIKSVIGINNYFKLSYDAARYKEQLNDKLAIKDELNKMKMDSLQFCRQQIAMKMVNLDLLKQAYSTPDTSDFGDIPKYDTSFVSPEAPGFSDSSGQNSLPEYNYSSKKDSIHSERLRYQAKYDSISRVITVLNTTMEGYKTNPANISEPSNPYLSRVQNLLSNIRKFEIGLCNPSYSTFLVSNIPVQGVNFEYASKDHFLAFTYGTTVNRILYDPKTIEGTMNAARNLYNFFDFGNLSTGRKILSLKGGTGQKEGTHLYAGILIGKGRTDYLSPYEGSSSAKESNLVVEIDGRYKFSSNLSLDLVFGKSSVQSEDLSFDQIKKSFKEIFSSFRSNAIQGKINYEIKKTSTKLTFSSRLVDPYFRSFGVGFMRSDNFRYEIKLDQYINKKIRYTVAFRREEDNLLRLYDYKNTLDISLKETPQDRFKLTPHFQLLFSV
ncbi:MAG: hypothetical protein M3R27_13990 [Bacteroidota bacterium]|nr:hypothetical protein [Bacteroidota bacterium]